MKCSLCKLAIGKETRIECQQPKHWACRKSEKSEHPAHLNDRQLIDMQRENDNHAPPAEEQYQIQMKIKNAG